ncbi:MAG: hypothetical protein VX438_06420, partial [Planctomycetota bacterium]|nr:hypothetical protein [Planctomycetota bacterium]
MTKCLFSLTLVGLCVWLSACSGDGNVTEEDGLKGLPVTVADVDKFRKTLDQVVLDRDHGKFTKMVSKPDWFRKIFQGLDISSAVQRDVESVINRAGNVSALGREIFESLSKQGRYECVRVEVAGKQRSVIYRFVQANTKVVRYHRYDLVRTARNKICVEDIYFYVEDESLASLVRQQVVHLLKSKSRLEPGGKIDWPQQVDLYPLSTNEFKKLNELMVGQDWKQSWKKINSFPETIRGSKIVQIRRLLVAGKLGEE